MPDKLNLDNSKEEISSFIKQLQQKAKPIKEMVVNNEQVGRLINLLTLKRKELEQFKKYSPAAVVVSIIVIGLIIGKIMALQSRQSISIPKPAAIPTVIAPGPESSLSSLKRSIQQLNPQLPDIPLPKLNDSIFLEEPKD